MQWRMIALSLVAAAGPAFAQDFAKLSPEANVDGPGYQEIFSPRADIGCEPESRGRLQTLLEGDRCFPNFIGFVSNPSLAIDPRALTQIFPMFVSAWTQSSNRIPAGDAQVYGAGLNVALGDRFSFGINKGGYAMSDIRRSRDGFLDTGGYAQFALIRDIERQFIFTMGLGVLTPWLGSRELFQGGNGPAYLSPYVTFGKEFGEFHILGTAGYQFPCGTDITTARTFYASLHFDRRVFGWLYPLVEFNGFWHDISVNSPRLDEIRGFFNLGRYDAAGRMLTVAPGFNAVIVHNRLELGAIYQTPIYSENHFRFHELLVKMILRF